MGKRIRVNGRLYEAIEAVEDADEKERLIVDYLESASDETLLRVWNSYCSEFYQGGEVFKMGKFPEVFEERDDPIWDAARLVYYGDFRPFDDYFWFDGNGNLESTKDLHKTDWIRPEFVAEYCVDTGKSFNDRKIENILNGSDRK